MTTLTTRRNNLFDSLFNDVFDDFFHEGVKLSPYLPHNVPHVNRRNAQVYNNNEDWQVVFAVPGVKKDAVEIKVDDHVLTVSYESDTEGNRFNFVSSFSRSWNVDREVDIGKIDATHEDGVLTITIPKPETKKRVVRTIQVN
mgnify:CR=1 FL=1|tara:strand:- start:2269 stop:2694 length:426 start_codon:yes stop_codon:yes gene_type:complete